MAIGLVELLSGRGFVPDGKRVKLIRHKDARWNVDALRKEGWFETYQQYQSKPVFDGCDRIVVFIGEEGRNARFGGVYGVGSKVPSQERPLPPDCPYPEWGEGKFFYPLTKHPAFADLEDRVIIDRGRGRWHGISGSRI